MSPQPQQLGSGRSGKGAGATWVSGRRAPEGGPGQPPPPRPPKEASTEDIGVTGLAGASNLQTGTRQPAMSSLVQEAAPRRGSGSRGRRGGAQTAEDAFQRHRRQTVKTKDRMKPAALGAPIPSWREIYRKRFRKAGRRNVKDTTQKPPEAEAESPRPDGLTHHLLQGAGAGSTRASDPRATSTTNHQPNKAGRKAPCKPAPAWGLRAADGL